MFNDKNLVFEFNFVIIETAEIFLLYHEFLAVLYNINKFINYINDLNIIRLSFETYFNSFYMQRVVKSFKILINKIHINNIKQLFFEYDLNDKDFRYRIHVLFLIVLKTFQTSIYFDKNLQKI